jgi:hypothetical protein
MAKGLSFVGDRYISGIDLDAEATFTGSIDIRFKDSTYYDLGVSGARSTRKSCGRSRASRSLSIATPAMRLERKGTADLRPRRYHAELQFPLRADVRAPMLTATLKSLVPAY